MGEPCKATYPCSASLLELHSNHFAPHAKLLKDTDEDADSTNEGSVSQSEGSLTPSSPLTDVGLFPTAEVGMYGGLVAGEPWAQAPVLMQPLLHSPPGLAPTVSPPSASCFTTAVCPITGQVVSVAQVEAGQSARERLRTRGQEILNRMKEFGGPECPRPCVPDRTFLATAVQKVDFEPRKLAPPEYAAASGVAALPEPGSPAKVDAPGLTPPPLDATMPAKKRVSAFLLEDSYYWQHGCQQW